MRGGLEKTNDRLVIGALFLVPIIAMVLDPQRWLVWTFIFSLDAGLMWYRMRMPAEKYTQKRLWVAWGLGTGHSLLMCYMTKEGNVAVQSGLMLSYQLAFLPFLNSRHAEERSLWFMLIGVPYSGLVAIALSFHDHPLAFGLGTAVLLAYTLFVLHLSHSFQQAHNPLGRRDWNRKELRWLVPVMGLALAVSLPVAWVAKTLDWEREMPSIGKLPSVSTSGAPVFLARFETQKPSSLYWTYSTPYVMPVGNGQWISLWDRQGAIEPEQAQALDLKNNLVSHRMGVGNNIHTYVLAPNEDDRFPLEGFAKSKRRDNNATEIHVWKQYVDKPLMGFDQALDALYLSIPTNTGQLPTQVDLSGAKKRMPKTWAMVQRWKSEGLTDQQFIDRTLAYFQENLAYHFDHQSMRPEENQLDWFLFEDRKGVCRHFANAFALIMRMGGIRSRIRGGFMGGAEIDDLVVVRERDAHAWTEVWMDGQGWVRIDPTSFVPVEKGVPEGPSFPWSKSDRRAWVNWDGKGFGTAGSAKDTNEGSGWLARAIERVEKLGKHAGLDQDRNWLVYVVPGLALGLLLGGLAWRKRPTTRPVEEIEWERLMEALHARGAIEAPHQGPRTIGLRLAQDWPQDQQHAWMELVLAYEQWRFGGVPAGDLAKRIKTWRKRVRKDFRKPGR